MKPLSKTFVLDTNVLLQDPRSIYSFQEHDLVIPITVLEELDTFKKNMDETGRNARTVTRYLDELRQAGSLRDGVKLPGGGILRIDLYSSPDVQITWGENTADNRILRTTVQQSRKGETVLVTRDVNMRLKCDALGVKSEDYANSHVSVDEHYTGVAERVVPGEVIDALYAAGSVQLEAEGLYPNQFVILSAAESPSKTAMVRYLEGTSFNLTKKFKDPIWGILPRNKEQMFALELLLDDNISLVTLDGFAGCGKTLIALACGLKRVADDQTYRKLLVSRPIFPLGKDIGYLPGSIEEKLSPWMKPIFDNLEYLVGAKHENPRGGKSGGESSYQQLLDQKLIEVEPLTYIRGRTIPKQFMIVDECQNLNKHEIKTILTRVGEGTKIVFTGDPNQIDNPLIDSMSNGLTYVIEKFKESSIAGHVTLKKGERSELAELAAKLL